LGILGDTTFFDAFFLLIFYDTLIYLFTMGVKWLIECYLLGHADVWVQNLCFVSEVDTKGGDFSMVSNDFVKDLQFGKNKTLGNSTLVGMKLCFIFSLDDSRPRCSDF